MLVKRASGILSPLCLGGRWVNWAYVGSIMSSEFQLVLQIWYSFGGYYFSNQIMSFIKKGHFLRNRYRKGRTDRLTDAGDVHIIPLHPQDEWVNQIVFCHKSPRCLGIKGPKHCIGYGLLLLGASHDLNQCLTLFTSYQIHRKSLIIFFIAIKKDNDSITGLPTGL